MKQSEIKEKIITELLQRVAKIRSGSIEDLLDSLESLEFYIPRTIQMYFDELPEPRIELDKNQIQQILAFMEKTNAGVVVVKDCEQGYSGSGTYVFDKQNMYSGGVHLAGGKK